MLLKDYFIVSGAQLLFLAIPLLFLACFRKSIDCLKLLPLVYFTLLVNILALNLFRHQLIDLEWNWEGKFLEALWPSVAVYLFKWLTPKEVGYLLPKKPLSWVIGATLGLALAFFGLIIDVAMGTKNDFPSMETLIFQFTLPGIAEESVYRGILLAVFNRYFGHFGKLFGAPIGWGLIFTTLLFTGLHVVHPTKLIIFDFGIIIPVTLAGFVFGWIREKTGSIWPAVLAHNFANGIYLTIRCIL
jgi:hypothetical protein